MIKLNTVVIVWIPIPAVLINDSIYILFVSISFVHFTNQILFSLFFSTLRVFSWYDLSSLILLNKYFYKIKKCVIINYNTIALVLGEKGGIA